MSASLVRRLVRPSALLLLLALPPGCDRKAEPGSVGTPGASQPDDAGDPASWLTRRSNEGGAPRVWVRDPSLADAAALPTPQQDPGWDLDAGDRARDYVRRYALATRRYGSTLDCIDVQPSVPQGQQRRVETRVAASCPDAGKVRDVFLVDVTRDRLTVDDKAKRDALTRWPDGSDPDGPASDKIREIDDMRSWGGPIDGVLRKRSLVPVRVQAYGRGSYPVVSLAGWHGAITPNASPETLNALASDICHANGMVPVGIFAAADRTLILRVRCPGTAVWETL